MGELQPMTSFWKCCGHMVRVCQHLANWIRVTVNLINEGIFIIKCVLACIQKIVTVVHVSDYEYFFFFFFFFFFFL